MSEHAQSEGHHPGPDPDVVPSNIMERLRAETWPLHQRAESAPRQRALVSGQVDQEAYVELLGQMYLLHKTLEFNLSQFRGVDGRAGSVVKDYQFQEPYLVEDLEFFGVDPSSVKAEEAVAPVLAEIEAAADERPLSLLGMHYVLEGSNNGGRFIAKALRKHFGLEPGKGDKYFDPYGEKQRELWAEFKADMLGCKFTGAEEDVIVEGAGEMFRHMIAISGGEISEPATA